MRYTSTPQYVFMVWCLVKHSVLYTLFINFAVDLYLQYMNSKANEI